MTATLDLSGTSLPERIIAARRRAPDAPAILFAGRATSYDELLTRAGAVASGLKRRGVGPETLVAVSLERSAEMVVACLGVMLAGAAYVPIEPDQPIERRRFIVTDCRAHLTIVAGSLANPGEGPFGPQLDIHDSSWQEAVSAGSEATAPPDPLSLAYVIYTSGSTGTPKGVAVTHAGFTNYIQAAVDYYRLDPSTRSLVHSSFAFDLTITSLWCVLAAGGVVELVHPRSAMDDFIRSIRTADGPRLLKITPAHLSVIADCLSVEDIAARRDTLVVGGEALTSNAVKCWVEAGLSSRLVNEYGPTETVVGCAVHDLQAVDMASPEVPIGAPIANLALGIWTEHLEPVPAGEIGEIGVSGPGVARGYVGRPDLTAEVFVPDPRSGEGARMYRTGDLGRQLPNGEFAFVGRRDTQVKVRGFRIELTEIEANLRSHRGVKDAAVLLVRGPAGRNTLRAFVAISGSLSAQSLRDFLTLRLPEYMIPTAFVIVESMPLTHNGKVDRRALAALPLSAPKAQHAAARAP